MRPFPRRFTIRGLMIGLAASTVLTVGAVDALRMVRLRADSLRQVGFHREMLEEATKGLAEAEAGLADPDEQALLDELPREERAEWVEAVDLLRRQRHTLAAALSRWQHLADHPWEPRPADLHRVD